MFSNRVRSALTTTVLATAASGFTAGCGIDTEEDQTAYCVDEDGKVVDDEFCDDDYRGPGAGLFFLYLGGFRSGLPVGTVLPRGVPRVDPGAATRQRAGLPGTGRVSAGTRVSGGIGKGTGGIGGRVGTGAGS